MVAHSGVLLASLGVSVVWCACLLSGSVRGLGRLWRVEGGETVFHRIRSHLFAFRRKKRVDVGIALSLERVQFRFDVVDAAFRCPIQDRNFGVLLFPWNTVSACTHALAADVSFSIFLFKSFEEAASSFKCPIRKFVIKIEVG